MRAVAIVAALTVGVVGAAGAEAAHAGSRAPVTASGLLPAVADGANATLRSARGGDPGAEVADTSSSFPVSEPGWTGSEDTATGLHGGTLQTEVDASASGPNGERITATATLTASVCPDAQGRVPVEVRTVATTQTAGGSTTEHQTVDFTGRVDDGAHLVSVEGGVSSSTRPQGSTGPHLDSWTVRGTLRSRGGDLRGRAPTVDTSVSQQADAAAVAREAYRRAANLAETVLLRAELLWREGHCVEVRVLEGGSRAVTPRQQVTIVAQPYHRLEGVRLAQPVTARLASGSSRVRPPRAGAPARFTYTGPSARPKRGTVELRTTSRRGIGTTTLTYTTSGDLRVTGTAYGGTYAGVKCDGPVGTWNITGSAPGDVRRESKITVTLDGSLTGSYEVLDQYFLGGNPAPDESSEAGAGAIYDPDAKTLRFGYPPGYALRVEEGSFCTNGRPNR